jgi:hypothetical protein
MDACVELTLVERVQGDGTECVQGDGCAFNADTKVTASTASEKSSVEDA